MKKNILLFNLLLCFVLLTKAQLPTSFNTNATAVNSNNELIADQEIAIRISILDNGSLIYSEIHTAATDKFGTINLNIGTGSVVTGIFSEIDWKSGAKSVTYELDENGGTSFTPMDEPLNIQAVPYSLWSKYAENIDDADSDPINEIQTISQEMSANGDIVILLSESNSITIPKENTTDEIQTLDLNGTQLNLSQNGGVVDLAILQDGNEDADSNPTNEIQDISLNGNILSISKGSSVDLSAIQDGVDDSDNDSSNEIQDISLDGKSLSISGGSTVDLTVIQDGVDDADNDSSNEIQDISLDGTNLNLSGGSTIDLSVIQDGVQDDDSDATNELQDLSLESDNLTISNGNSVNLAEYKDALWNLNSSSVLKYEIGDVEIPNGDLTMGIATDLTAHNLFVNSASTFSGILNANEIRVNNTYSLPLFGGLAGEVLTIQNDGSLNWASGNSPWQLNSSADLEYNGGIQTNGNFNINGNVTVTNGGLQVSNGSLSTDFLGVGTEFSIGENANVTINSEASFTKGVQIHEVLKLIQTTEPANPQAGWMYFDAFSKKLRVWDGSQWQDCF